MARRYNSEDEELQTGDGRHFVDEEEYDNEEEEEETETEEEEDDDPEPEYEDYGNPYADEDEE